MNNVQPKNELRKQMLIKRKMLNGIYKNEYDSFICNYLWNIIVKKEYKNIHCYIPMDTEINLIPLIKKMLIYRMTVITPKALSGGRMENLILDSLEDLENGIFGTKHPKNGKQFTGKYDLIIVPGLAFTTDNWRLGYGGGYYDRFLINYPGTYKIGICYPFQRLQQIPLEEHDVQLDEVYCL